VNALQFLLTHPDPDSVTIEQLMDFVHGPDFPTGGIVYNKKDILDAYTRGR
jgi:DNA gyrase subunit A